MVIKLTIRSKELRDKNLTCKGRLVRKSSNPHLAIILSQSCHFYFISNSQITSFQTSCFCAAPKTTLQGDHWPLLFLNLTDTFSPSYLTYWQPLLLLITTSLLKCTVALISLMLTLVPTTVPPLVAFSHFSLLLLRLEIVKGVSGGGLGGTVILTITVSICF